MPRGFINDRDSLSSMMQRCINDDTWLHRTVAIHRDFGTSRGDTWAHLVHLDAMIPIVWWTHIQVAIVSHDHRVIVAQLLRDRGHDRLALMAHDHRAIVAINRPFTGSNGPHISRKFPFKNRCVLSLLLNS